MEEISQLGLSASQLYEAFSEAESVFFSGPVSFSAGVTQFLFNERFVSKD